MANTDFDKFRMMVLDDIHGRALEETKLFLRKPEHITNWAIHLAAVKRDIDSQLAILKAEFNERITPLYHKNKTQFFKKKHEHDQHRATMIQIQNEIEQRMCEIKHVQNSEKPMKKEEPRSKKIIGNPELLHLVHWAAKIVPKTGDGLRWHQEFECLFW
jgi:hypothetical protein